MKRAVVIVSGGMDSAVALAIAKSQGYELITLHFNYNQRTQKKELECFYKLSKALNATNSYVIDLPFFEQIGASALTDHSIDVPTIGIQDGVPVTYVPFRNGIFLSIASAIAEKEKAKAIYIGVVEEDSSGYPDCRESYIKAMQKAINLGTKDDTNIEIKMPLVHMKKSQIIKKALELKVPLEFTWSCYKDEDVACGVCDSCRLRLNGFSEAGLKDPIPYKDI